MTVPRKSFLCRPPAVCSSGRYLQRIVAERMDIMNDGDFVCFRLFSLTCTVRVFCFCCTFSASYFRRAPAARAPARRNANRLSRRKKVKRIRRTRKTRRKKRKRRKKKKRRKRKRTRIRSPRTRTRVRKKAKTRLWLRLPLHRLTLSNNLKGTPGLTSFR